MCNFTAQNFRDDLFFVLFHFISAFDIAFGVALHNLLAAIRGFGIYNKVETKNH